MTGGEGMILTDEEIQKIAEPFLTAIRNYRSFGWAILHDGDRDVENFAREIEKAVVAKLEEARR